MTGTPTYEEILATSRNGGTLRQFLLALEPGKPAVLPGTGEARARSVYANSLAKLAGVPIATRTIDGVPWVVRLLPDDAMSRLRAVSA